jgi:hypothetical protein
MNFQEILLVIGRFCKVLDKLTVAHSVSKIATISDNRRFISTSHSPPLHPILSQMNPFHTLENILLRAQFS